MALAHSEAANPHWVPRKKIGDLSHIPGENGPPIIGTTFRVLRDPPGYGARMVKTYGKVFRTNAFGNPIEHIVCAFGTTENAEINSNNKASTFIAIFTSKRG
jgi:hypothetical protein